jgi:hypothetical protein
MFLAIARIAIERQRGTDQVALPQAPNISAPAGMTGLVPTTSVAWNDSLDDEIALAAATIDQFSHSPRGFDGSLLDMNDQLQALSRELFGETL